MFFKCKSSIASEGAQCVCSVIENFELEFKILCVVDYQKGGGGGKGKFEQEIGD